MSIPTISAIDFKTKVLASTQPVVIDFYADWCGPCQMLSPLLAKVSHDFPDVNFYAVNVDDFPDFANSLDVSSIPTLIRFMNGQETNRSTGLLSEPKLINFIKG